MSTDQALSSRQLEFEAIKALLQTGRSEADLQKEMRDHVDTKTSVILGFSLASVVELLGFMLLVAAEKNVIGSVPYVFFAVFFSGIVLLVISAVACVFELWPMQFYYPDLEYVRFRYSTNLAPETVGRAIVNRYRASVRLNSRVAERKSRLVITAAIAGTLSLLLMSACVVWLFVVVAQPKTSDPTHSVPASVTAGKPASTN